MVHKFLSLLSLLILLVIPLCVFAQSGGGKSSCELKLRELAKIAENRTREGKLKITFDQKKAEELLGPLSQGQIEAIEKAHRVGDGEIGRDRKSEARIGNYTAQQLQDKYNILADSGFSKSQIKLLMDNQIVGKNDLTRDYLSGELDEDFAPQGGRTTEGTKNNKGVRSAAQQVQEAGTLAKLNEQQRIRFGDVIHAIKEDLNCPKEWIDRETGDLTWHALVEIARGIKRGQLTFY